VPNGTGLTITGIDEITGEVIVVGSVPVTGGTRTIDFYAEDEDGNTVIAPGEEAHRHYTWEFSGNSSAVNIRTTVIVSGAPGDNAGNYNAVGNYRFTF